jgi:hypothetical protein
MRFLFMEYFGGHRGEICGILLHPIAIVDRLDTERQCVQSTRVPVKERWEFLFTSVQLIFKEATGFEY